MVTGIETSFMNLLISFALFEHSVSERISDKNCGKYNGSLVHLNFHLFDFWKDVDALIVFERTY
jgi:hypothetical protein